MAINSFADQEPWYKYAFIVNASDGGTKYFLGAVAIEVISTSAKIEVEISWDNQRLPSQLSQWKIKSSSCEMNEEIEDMDDSPIEVEDFTICHQTLELVKFPNVTNLQREVRISERDLYPAIGEKPLPKELNGPKQHIVAVINHIVCQIFPNCQNNTVYS